MYVVGFTDGEFPGQTNEGREDAFIRKYNSDGDEEWTGSLGHHSVILLMMFLLIPQVCMWLAPRMANFLIRQMKEELMHLSASTIPMVMRSGRGVGTSGNDSASGVSADSSGVYVVGTAQGTLPDQTSEGGQDAFIRKYNSDGDEEWTLAVWDI